MPIDFMTEGVNTRFTFTPHKGSERREKRTFELPSDVKRAVAFVNGFKVGFTNSEQPLGQMEINTKVSKIDHKKVEVELVFRLRDKSANFDNEYEGFIDVGLIVERV